jgi:hypothetical protein
VIVSLLYKVARGLLSVPGVLLRRDTAKEAELLVLRHENAVLRRQRTGPVRYEPADRFWLAALSTLIPRRRWRDIFPVAPGTLLAWHRRLIAVKWDYSARRSRIGRPPTAAAIKKLVLPLAQENTPSRRVSAAAEIWFWITFRAEVTDGHRPGRASVLVTRQGARACAGGPGPRGRTSACAGRKYDSAL